MACPTFILGASLALWLGGEVRLCLGPADAELELVTHQGGDAWAEYRIERRNGVDLLVAIPPCDPRPRRYAYRSLPPDVTTSALTPPMRCYRPPYDPDVAPRDGRIGPRDFNAFRSSWGKADARFDVNRDGKIGIVDWNAFRGLFGARVVGR